MGIAAITATPEREKEVGFTDSDYMDDQAIVTMADNTEITGDNYADALNAEGVKIAVQSGSTAEAFAKENFPNAELVPFKNATDLLRRRPVQPGERLGKPTVPSLPSWSRPPLATSRLSSRSLRARNMLSPSIRTTPPCLTL